MDRMSPLDAAFLQAEDEEPETSMAIASIAVFDGPAPSLDELTRAYAAHLPLIPRYRQRIVPPYAELGPPVWVDDPDFDISFHLRRTALPAPGGDAEMFALMARVMGQRLDRSRPATADRWAAHRSCRRRALAMRALSQKAVSRHHDRIIQRRTHASVCRMRYSVVAANLSHAGRSPPSGSERCRNRARANAPSGSALSCSAFRRAIASHA